MTNPNGFSLRLHQELLGPFPPLDGHILDFAVIRLHREPWASPASESLGLAFFLPKIRQLKISLGVSAAVSEKIFSMDL
jgi:hypothetical protein